MKISSQELIGERIRIRPICYEDIELIRKWRNKDSIRKFFIYNKKISKEQQIQWWEKYKNTKNDIMFVIEIIESGIPIGTLALYNIKLNEEAEFGRMMIGEEDARGKGYALEALNLVSMYGFELLNLKKINLEVFKENERAFDLYLKSRFIVVREDEDLIYMSVLKTENNNDH